MSSTTNADDEYDAGCSITSAKHQLAYTPYTM